MKERALEIRKQILPMKDAFEQLTLDERDELKVLQKEHDDLMLKLTADEHEWYENKLAEWYAKYLDVETKIFIKPCEG